MNKTVKKILLNSKIKNIEDYLTGSLEGELIIGTKLNGNLNFNFELNIDSDEKLKNLFPLIPKNLSVSKGNLKILGQYGIKNDDLFPSINLKGKDISLEYDSSKLKDLSFHHHISDLRTFRGLGTNQIKIGELDVGQKVTNFAASYSMKSLKQVVFKSADLEVLGGKVSSKNFQLAGNEFKNLKINLTSFPLEPILKIALKDGVKATGEIEGVLPVVYRQGIPNILGGRLKNSSKGHIKYDPGSANPLKSMQHNQVDILMRYLKDFKYNKLLIDVDSDERYNLALRSKFFGTNPKAYHGRPLKLGINLDLNIKDTIVASLMFMKIPKKIEERILKDRRL